MSTNKLIGIVLYAVASFLLGWLVYGIALMSFMTANTTMYSGLMKDQPDLIVLFLANIAWGGMAVQIVDALQAYNFMDAIKKTLPIVFCVMLGVDLGYMSMMNLYNWTAIIVDILAGTIMWSACNGLIGWWLGRGRTTA